MFTAYDKAIAAFLTSVLGVLAAFNLNLAWFNATTIAAITPFLTMVVTWLVPNKIETPAGPPPVPNLGSGPGV